MELEGIHLVSYLVLGVLFFVVIWSVAEKVIQGIFPHKGIGLILGAVIASYGFWYPFIPALRMLYLVMLIAISVIGVGFSRIYIVARWSIRGSWFTAAIVLALVLFEIIQYITNLQGYTLAAIASWGLLIYGIIGIREQSIEPVITSMGLPRANLVQAAFVLACVVFLPLEFPAIYTLLSLAAVSGIVLGWYLSKS